MLVLTRYQARHFEILPDHIKIYTLMYIILLLIRIIDQKPHLHKSDLKN